MNIEIVNYTPAYAGAFKALNEAWINKYFELEEDDIQTLNYPEKILVNGGFIFIALKDHLAVGTCAIRRKGVDIFELSKMAVSEDAQGLGIGRMLGETAIAKAKEVGAKRVYLEGNTRLESSIHLYKKLGFTEIVGGPSPYKRVNIVMALEMR
ncbi:MAG TPA: GNAT family N-acetyltransferase [Cyclobacteriaceae bacterium]|nr:GNAT family N-acetyltransferase [Cyclobacteriaceae bacterium]